MQKKSKYVENRSPQKPQGNLPFRGGLAGGAIPVDPFELALVISMAGQIAQKGGENVYQQILVELRELYRAEKPEKLVSVCWRLFSLYKLIQSGDLDEFMDRKAVQRNLPMPSSVVFVAATLPLKDSKGFPSREFIAAVRECIAAERY
jgi:hypothetical protein